MARIARLLRHLSGNQWQLRRAFPRATLDAIAREIAASETRHAGELRFAVEATLPGAHLLRDLDARERAIDVFGQLRMWDTDERNGILIYLLMADRSVEIVADRGVHGRVGAQPWEQVCGDMKRAFRAGDFENGAINGVRALTRLLATHYPAGPHKRDALSNQVVLL